MLKLKTSVFRMLLLCLAAAVVLPLESAAQTVTGSISGTVVDPQGAVVPGATATVVNESTSDSRVAVTDDRVTSRSPTCQPGRYTVRVELASFRTLRAEERGAELVGTCLGRDHRARSRRPRRDRDRRSDRLAREHRGNAAWRRHHADADRTDPGPRPGCDVPHAAVARRPLHRAGRLDGRHVRGGHAERRRSAGRLGPGDHRRRRRQRNRQQRHERADGQPGCDRRSAAAEQLVSRGIRSVGRLSAPDRHSRRQLGYRGSGYYYGRHERFNSTEFFRARSQRLQGIDPFPPSTDSTPMAPTSAARC